MIARSSVTVGAGSWPPSGAGNADWLTIATMFSVAPAALLLGDDHRPRGVEVTLGQRDGPVLALGAEEFLLFGVLGAGQVA